MKTAEEIIRDKFKLGKKPYPEYQWNDDFAISVKEIIELMESYHQTLAKDCVSKEFIEHLCNNYQEFQGKFIELTGKGEYEDPYTTTQPFCELDDIYNHWLKTESKK